MANKHRYVRKGRRWRGGQIRERKETETVLLIQGGEWYPIRASDISGNDLKTTSAFIPFHDTV